MKLFITSGIILALAAFSGAQQVTPSAEQVSQASGSQSVRSAVVPPMADIAKSAVPPAAVQKGTKKKKNAAPGVITILPSGEKAAAVPAPAAPAAGAGFAVTRKHVVVQGETLWDISGKYYKDPFKWGKIYSGNLDKISDPDLIYPRSEIFIPEITEVIRPVVKPETVADTAAPGSEEGVAVTAGEPAAASGLLTRKPLEDLAAGMSEEMPVDLKEWSDSVKIAPGGWDPDGVISGVTKSDTDAMPGSLTVSGEMVRIKVYKKGVLRPGHVVTAYMRGAVAVDENGKELGRELQKTGILEVVSVDGSVVVARVVEATTSVGAGQLIVK